jgi:hypothetical protein
MVGTEGWYKTEVSIVRPGLCKGMPRLGRQDAQRTCIMPAEVVVRFRPAK